MGLRERLEPGAVARDQGAVTTPRAVHSAARTGPIGIYSYREGESAAPEGGGVIVDYLQRSRRYSALSLVNVSVRYGFASS